MSSGVKMNLQGQSLGYPADTWAHGHATKVE
jgi:hypothetical protein